MFDQIKPDTIVKIPLTGGFVIKLDAADWFRLRRWRWSVSRAGGKVYAVRRALGERAYLHHDIIGHGDADVDHANGDSLDNRRVNLRHATRSQNSGNIHFSQRVARSGERGIYVCDSGRVYVQIQCEGRKHSIHGLKSMAQAVVERDELGRKLFGRFWCSKIS